MSFPQIVLQDNFNRPDGGLGANWSDGPIPAFGCSLFKIETFAAAPDEDPTAQWWNVAEHGDPADIVADIKNGLDTVSGTYVEILFNLQEVAGVIVDGYRLRFGVHPDSGGTVKIQLLSALDDTLIDGTYDTGNPTIPNGGRIGLRVNGTDVAAYIDYGDGTWVLETTLTTDGAITGGGYAGLLWTQITWSPPA